MSGLDWKIAGRWNHPGYWLARLTILVAATGMTIAAAAQEIANGSFERADPEGAPESWSVQARQLSVDLESASSDERGQVLKVSGTEPNASAMIRQALDLGPTGFSGATLRGRIRTSDIATSATLFATLEGPEGRIFMDDMRDRVVAGDTEWQEYSIQIPAAEDARSLTVGALVIGPGTAWFDDLELTQARDRAAADMDVRDYVLEALSIMRENYLHAEDVDWDRVRERGLASLPDDASVAQAHAAIRMMLEALDDPHVGAAGPGSSDAAKEQSDSVEHVTVEMADERIARIRVPSVPGSIAEAARVAFADNAHQALKAVDSPELCGWVVDLRDNTGGNMWPMLATIGPIAGPGMLGQFVGPDGEQTNTWTYRDGVAEVSSDTERSERVAISTDAFRPESTDLPAAVLVSPRTSSSGEATAIAFIGRENTRLFGSETGGLATANNGFPLSDGFRMIFPIGYMADRHGNIHHPHVEPDEEVSPEEALDHATKWLQDQPGCSDEA